MTAMAARFVAERNYDCTAFWHALDLALKNPKLRRIDQIVGGINREQRRANFFEVWPGIVIVCSFERVEHVIGVGGFHVAADELVERLICFREGGRLVLSQPRIAP